MKERVMAITKDYAIHISLGALLAFGGAVWWMSATYATIRINEKNITEIKSTVVTELKSINTRLSRIEGALGVKKPENESTPSN